MFPTFFLLAVLAVGAHANVFQGTTEYCTEGVSAPENGEILGVFREKDPNSKEHDDVSNVEEDYYIGLGCNDGFTEKGHKYIKCEWNPFENAVVLDHVALSGILTCTDDEAPVISCSANEVVTTDDGLSTAAVVLADATATDNVEVIDVTSEGLPADNAYPVGDTTVTYTATDAAGNSASCSVTVTVSDDEAPVISCSANEVVTTDDGLSTAAVVLADATATDNVKVIDVTSEGLPADNAYPVGDTTVTYTATDAAGNSASCSVTVTVSDKEKPELTAPTDLTFCNDAGKHFRHFAEVPSPTCSDNVDGENLEVTLTYPNSGTFGLGECDITATCTDDAGNSCSLTYIVIVNDCDKCTFTAQDGISLPTDDGQDFATVSVGGNFALPSVQDNSQETITPTCSIDDVELPATVNLNGECLANATIHCVASDSSGNECSLDIPVQVSDNEVPSIQQLPDIVEYTEPGKRYADLTLSSPNCSDNNGVTSEVAECLYPLNGRFGVGSCVIKCYCEDTCGHRTEDDYTVEIRYWVPPECDDPRTGNVQQVWYQDRLTKTNGKLAAGTRLTLACEEPFMFEGNQEVVCENIDGDLDRVQWDKTPGSCVQADTIGDFTCAEGYTAVRDFDNRAGYCYRFVDTEDTHDNIEADCKSDGGHLADVDSYIEHQSMLAFLQDIGRETSMSWISTNDEGTEGTYINSNGEVLPLTLWCPDAPSALPDNDEDCSITSTMGWNDVPCDSTHFGFCESDPIFAP